jgi:subtilisin family serine protease
MQVSQEVNSFGYIVRFKTGTTALDNAIDSETKMKNRADAILKKKRPRHNIVPTVINVFNTIKAFSIPLVSDEYIAALETEADILSIEPDIEVSAYAQSVPWGVTRIGTSSSTVADIDGDASVNNTNIFILDTGVAPNHPDLNRVAARSFVPRETNVDDLNGHGTAVTGVAAARDNTQGIVGVCPGAKIHGYKCLDRGCSGQLSWIIAAIEAVSAWKSALPSGSTERAVVNMSLGHTHL